MVTAEQIMDELHIDVSDEETATITALIAQAQDIIRSSVDYNQPLASYQQYPMFDRAVTTLVTQLYYDRELSEGMSNGLKMMINHLKGRMLNGK